MNRFSIKIPSDSSITKIEISGEELIAFFGFDIEVAGRTKAKMVFKNHSASYISPGWNIRGGVEGIAIESQSALLDETKKKLQEEYEESDVQKLKSYQIVGTANLLLVEIIAEDYRIE